MNTIDSWYIAVHHNTILHTSQQIRRKYFGQTSNPRKTPISRANGRALGVFASYFEKNDREISGVNNKAVGVYS